MIECLKEVLYYESWYKIIIVVIYSLYFFDFRLLDNIFIFYKINNELCVKKMDFVELGSICKIIEIEDLKRFLFLLYVFFVEGKFDKIVL